MAKHNWNELEIEYLKSEYMSVRKFIAEFMKVKPNWSINEKTKGWSEKKLEILQEAKEEATESFRKAVIKAYTPTQEEVDIIYKAVMWVITAKAIANYQKIRKLSDWTILIPPDVNMWETTKIFEIVRTLNHEPLSYKEKDDFIPEWDWDDEDDVVFYLPNNWRELWEWENK